MTSALEARRGSHLRVSKEQQQHTQDSRGDPGMVVDPSVQLGPSRVGPALRDGGQRRATVPALASSPASLSPYPLTELLGGWHHCQGSSCSGCTAQLPSCSLLKLPWGQRSEDPTCRALPHSPQGPGRRERPWVLGCLGEAQLLFGTPQVPQLQLALPALPLPVL